MKKAAFILTLVILFNAAPFGSLAAKNSISTELSASGFLSKGQDDDTWSLAALQKGRLNFRGSSQDVRARFSLDFTATESMVSPSSVDLSIYLAFARMNFEHFRLTLGKSKTVWGNGVYFNAGDLLHGSVDLAAGLTDSVIRDQSAWQAGFWLPLDDFSYFETIAALPLAEPFNPQKNLDLEQTDLGLRWAGDWQDLSLEIGYLFSGVNLAHTPYLALQGYIPIADSGFDWYLSAADTISQDTENIEQYAKDNFRITVGLFFSHNFESGDTLALRLEALIKAFGEWEAQKTIDPITALTEPDYGLYLYPELSWSPSSNFALLFNGVFSVIDLSASLAVTSRFKLFKNLTMINGAAVRIGEEDDTYAWKKAGGLSIILVGIDYIF